MVSDIYSLIATGEAVVNVNELSLPKAQTDQIISEIIAYLHNHYTDDLQISDLERQFALNRTTLAERFKEVTGQSVMSYLRNLRLRTAASLLQETKVPVSEICERVGFGDISHFGRVFKEEFSLTPKEYRDQFCWVG
jgi:AraC family L-rhamnose operon regulatory protein RhaS